MLETQPKPAGESQADLRGEANALGAEWSLLDHVQMEQELAGLLGRNIDLLSRRAVEHSHNWLRRREILNTAEVVYAAQ
ncbi:MAG: hypothetical protein L0312_15670 [Acidobacteria bacterium]|nr:hypothetical protein [Acidobacteriota bacterium]